MQGPASTAKFGHTCDQCQFCRLPRRRHLSELVSRVHDHHERVTVTVHGRPSAVLLAVEDVEALEETIGILSDTEAMIQSLRSLGGKARLKRIWPPRCVGDARSRDGGKPLPACHCTYRAPPANRVIARGSCVLRRTSSSLDRCLRTPTAPASDCTNRLLIVTVPGGERTG